MNHAFNKTRIFFTMALSLSTIPLIANAADAKITKVVDDNSELRGVIVATPQVVFYVTVYGNLEKITPNNPALIKAQRFARVLGKRTLQPKVPLTIKYYPTSQFNGNGGKVAQVNGIRINYYACITNNETLTGVHNYGNTIHNISGNFPVTYNKNFQFMCRSLDGNGGKVRSIGSVNFTYYPYDRMNYNGGKLARVGTYAITYHNPNSFTGKAGQLQSFGN